MKLRLGSNFKRRGMADDAYLYDCVKYFLKLGALCIFATLLARSQSRLVIDSDEFRYTANFHQSRISEGRLRELLLFSPYSLDTYTKIDQEHVIVGYEETHDSLKKSLLAYSLESCIDSDPRYSLCGSRDISDPNFLSNAHINVDRNDQILVALDRMNIPPELEKIAQQYRDSMIYSSTIERRRLKYLQTGNLQVLSQKVVSLDPLITCSKEIAELKNALTLQRQYESSRNGWPNCMIQEWNRISPAYPREAWARFLRNYGISEQYTYKPVD